MVLMDGVLKIIKSKLKSKTGYLKADEANDYVWLLETLEDIMINFKELARQVQNENFTYGVENTCSHENMNRWRYTLHACARRQVRERNYKVHGY